MQKILILGGTGSLGHKLVDHFSKTNEIYIYSRDENKQWAMKQEYKELPEGRLHFVIGDIRDRERFKYCLHWIKPNIIIIAAALKHIDICEFNPGESITTNILGIKNVIDTVAQEALEGGIDFLETVLFVSTDKACSPVNVYGMCKSISERLMVEKSERIAKPKFLNVRYGNVINSRGSLIPVLEGIAKDPSKKFFYITDLRMTRFFMTLKESVDLIDNTLKYGETGDTYIPKSIKSCKIHELIKYFSEKYQKPIKITGIRPGEKLHECLINITEINRTTETDHGYVIKPCYARVPEEELALKDEFTSADTLEGIWEIFFKYG